MRAGAVGTRAALGQGHQVRHQVHQCARRNRGALPAFKDAFKRKRCLIPATAFFEWSGEKGRKTKWRVTVKDEPLFAFAGLWEWWRDPSKPHEPGIETYTILTTEPNDLLSDIHDRMPVIVLEKDYDDWLENGSPELLRPIPSEMVQIAAAA